MLITFVREPAFSKHVQPFHRALTKHYSQGGKHLYDQAFCDQHAPGLFGQLYKSIVNDDKEKPFKKRLEIQKPELLQCYTISDSSAIRYKSHTCTYVLFVPMENSKAVVTFSRFNLFFH